MWRVEGAQELGDTGAEIRAFDTRIQGLSGLAPVQGASRREPIDGRVDDLPARGAQPTKRPEPCPTSQPRVHSGSNPWIQASRSWPKTRYPSSEGRHEPFGAASVPAHEGAYEVQVNAVGDAVSVTGAVGPT